MFEEILFRIGLVSNNGLMYWGDFNAKDARFFDMLGFIKNAKVRKALCEKLCELIF